MSGILFTACGKKEEVVDNNQPTDVAVEPSSCEKAVKKYLDGVDKKWSWEWVKNWDNATVDYIGRLEDGTVFETTIRSIAEACDIYDETIDYTQWYEFNVGVNQMIKWFDEWVIWMKVWQTKTVEVSPENWYWVYNKNNVVKYTADEIWDLSKYTEWQTIYLSMWVSAKVLEVTDKYVTLDFNHELAGKTLIFDITLKAIN